MSGHISRESLTSGEVARFQESIKERLEDASNTQNSNRTRLEQAYHAIFNCAWIALRVDGYRANSKPGHHRVVLESMAETIGTANRDIDYFLGTLAWLGRRRVAAGAALLFSSGLGVCMLKRLLTTARSRSVPWSQLH